MVQPQKLVIDSHGLYQFIVQPMLADILPSYNGPYNGILSEFTVMDEVPFKGTPIVDIWGRGNIMKRRDNTCNVVWSKIATTTSRKVTVTEVYAATKTCQNEFYSGCLKDFRSKNPYFKKMILEYFQKIFYMDLAVNSYFGDTTRAEDSTDTYAWNEFDGIFTHIANYITNGTIPVGQTISLSPGAISASTAYNTLVSMFAKQDRILVNQPVNNKAFYVSYQFASAYEDYLISTGATGGGLVGLIVNGMPALKYKGIPIYVEPIWDDVLLTLNGGSTQKHAAVLTLRNNFIFATNKNYGGGPDENEGLVVWYSYDDDEWKNKMYGAYGTEIIAPKQIVVAI